jgi:hypothetical protein
MPEATPSRAEPPRVVISLDFEMRWGVHDSLGLDFDAYRANLESVPLVVPALLHALSTRNVRATWAAVGALGCLGWDEYFRRAPPPPRYVQPHLAVRPEYAELDPSGALHFAPALIAAINSTPGQDLGTHTFSHLHLREAGVTAEDVAADLAAVTELYSERYGFAPVSLVFPRNEPAFLDVYRNASIRMWRGNESAWYYDCQGPTSNSVTARVLRLAEALHPLCTRAAPLEGDMTRASLFLRLNLPRVLWDAHVLRVKRELRALTAGSIFHLWCHPHNVGPDVSQRLPRVEQILDLIAEGVERRAFVSASMRDLVAMPGA